MAKVLPNNPICFIVNNGSVSALDKMFFPKEELFLQQYEWITTQPKFSYNIQDHMKWLRKGENLFLSIPGNFFRLQDAILIDLAVRLESYYRHLRGYERNHHNSFKP